MSSAPSSVARFGLEHVLTLCENQPDALGSIEPSTYSLLFSALRDAPTELFARVRAARVIPTTSGRRVAFDDGLIALAGGASASAELLAPFGVFEVAVPVASGAPREFFVLHGACEALALEELCVHLLEWHSTFDAATRIAAPSRWRALDVLRRGVATGALDAAALAPLVLVCTAYLCITMKRETSRRAGIEPTTRSSCRRIDTAHKLPLMCC